MIIISTHYNLNSKQIPSRYKWIQLLMHCISIIDTAPPKRSWIRYPLKNLPLAINVIGSTQQYLFFYSTHFKTFCITHILDHDHSKKQTHTHIHGLLSRISSCRAQHAPSNHMARIFRYITNKVWCGLYWVYVNVLYICM